MAEWHILGLHLPFWIYLFVAGLFAANIGIRIVAWWYTRMDPRLEYATRIAVQGVILYSACLITASFAALAFSPWMSAEAALWGVRVGWICIAVTATIITDQWIAELNGHSSGIYKIWHWSQMMPKRKLLLYALLVMALYMATSCEP